jgi:hypothetical protein
VCREGGSKELFAEKGKAVDTDIYSAISLPDESSTIYTEKEKEKERMQPRE